MRNFEPWNMYKLEFRYSGGWFVSAWYVSLDKAIKIALRSLAAYEFRITRGEELIRYGFLDAHYVLKSE